MQKNIIFLCSPSVGMLDSWLPIIQEIKTRRPTLDVVMMISTPDIAARVESDTLLFQMAEKVISRVVVRICDDVYVETMGFQSVSKIGVISKFDKILLRLLDFFGQHSIFNILRRFLKNLLFLSSSQRAHDGKRFIFSSQYVGEALLYDVYEETKVYNLEIINALQGISKYSISHGANINNGGVLAESYGDSLKVSSNVRAFLYSSLEIPIYTQRFGLNYNDLVVTGIPRHSKEWIDKISENVMPVDNEEQFVFVISRPAGPYFPPDRKRRAVEIIKNVVWNKLGKKIVVKLHPKEHLDEVYDQVLGGDTYGEKWSYSTDHPFVIAKNSDFAITFYSGVSIDMIALGVPVVEVLDLRGLSGFDNDASLRDDDGNPVFSYRYLGLVLGVSNQQQLEIAVQQVSNNRQVVLDQLKQAYLKLYQDPSESIRVITDEVLNA